MDLSKLSPLKRAARSTRGYSLVEVLVAGGILALGIGAACVMSLTMATQEEMLHRMARNLNLQENAARMYQLGLNASEITGSNGLLPGSNDLTLSFATSNATLAGLGVVPAQTITATIKTTPDDSILPTSARGWTGGSRRADSTQARSTRVVDLVVFRATP
jgi:type II secretory pathway pseudopilin PulG